MHTFKSFCEDPCTHTRARGVNVSARGETRACMFTPSVRAFVHGGLYKKIFGNSLLSYEPECKIS